MTNLQNCSCGGIAKYCGSKGAKWIACPKCGNQTEISWTWRGARQRWKYKLKLNENNSR